MQTKDKPSSPVMERTRFPGIYKRGGRYVAVTTRRGRQTKSFHRTIAEAREAKAQRESGDGAPVSRQTFERYAREWIETYTGRTARGLSDTTRADYRRSLDLYAIPFFRAYKLVDIAAPDVRRFVASLDERGQSLGSMRKHVGSVKALFSTAAEDGAIRANPAASVRVIKREQTAPEPERVKALTRAELALVLAAIPARHRLLFDVLAQTGLRISEVAGLRWQDVELGGRPVLRVQTQVYRGKRKALKSAAGRRQVPLSTATARRLWEARSTSPYRKETDPVFPSVDGTPFDDHNLRRRVLDPAAKRAGVPGIGFHTFRHTCATLLFAEGRNAKQVATWLGHTDPAFTLRTYVGLLDGDLGGADFLDDVIPPVAQESSLAGEDAATAS